MLTGFNHVSIVVPDIEAAARTLGEKYGLQVGERMVNDHSKANDELKQIASSKGVDLPNDLNAKDKMLKERLSKLSGDSFDKAYMQNMVKDHRKDVAEFSKESRSASDPEVKQFAGKTLPTLKEHLQKAESIAPSAKTSGSSSTSH